VSADTSRVPRFLEIADELHRHWAKLAPNTPVESETQLAERFGVNRQTAREVMKELERRAAVRRIVGRGTFTALKLDYPIERGRPPSFRRLVAELGREHSILSKSVRWRPARGERPRALISTRTIAVDGLVAAHATDEIVEHVGEQLHSQIADGASIHDAFVSIGLQPWRRRVAVTMGQPPSAIGADLGFVSAAPPSWRVRSETVDVRSGDTIHRSDTWMRSDVFDVRIELDLPVER